MNNNGIDKKCFAGCVLASLTQGRGKYRNVSVIGAANCGKTFILQPLTQIYKCFRNPATANFAWVGVDEAEVIFLNDFRWTSQIIPWHDLLLLLEGQLVHFPAPKCHFAKDISLESDTPIFCTGKRSIVLIKRGEIDERETEMMAVRWRLFSFSYQIPESDQVDIPPCPRCFAEFILK